MMTPRALMGALLLVQSGLVYSGILTHHGTKTNLARLVISCIAAFAGTQVLFGRRLPGFRWRARAEA
jgi:hypothetical protein